MKQIQTALSKLSPHNTGESKKSTKEDGAAFAGEDTTHVWTVGEEYQFYVPWLWKQSPEPPPDKMHPNRQVVRIPRPTVFPGLTEELRHAWIQNCVTSAVRDLVYDKDHYLTCTESQVEQWRYDQTEAWKHFSIVQRKCNLPKITIPGYDGVFPVEMTIVIRRVSIRKDRATSSCVEWLDLPSPGKCIERIKNQVRIHLTPECSLHTHIRPKTIPEVDLQSFKKLASFLWLAEDRLNKLYHPARSNLDSSFHRSLRRCSNLALDKSPLVTGDVHTYAAVLGSVDIEPAEKTKLVTIWQAGDRHQLRELLRIHHTIGKHDRPAYNFFNLFKASEKQTIEFRKTESTIDGQVIDAWIEVFVVLAEFCMTCSIETFQSVAESLGKPQDAYSTWQLLGDIGCKRPVVEVLKQKFIQQWLQVPEESGRRSTSRDAANSTGSNSNSASRPRLRDAIREGVEKIGGKIAEGYSYGG
ncbi:hypothetical protein F5883DRAFT_618262 [Diaporthe sp. PMI_573]|nr:hypothetical protein F5883DRAFT_618262 [Diaporthaceae sp. PMI_573]